MAANTCQAEQRSWNEKTRVAVAKSFDCNEHLAKVKTNTMPRWQATKKEEKLGLRRLVLLYLPMPSHRLYPALYQRHFLATWAVWRPSGCAGRLLVSLEKKLRVCSAHEKSRETVFCFVVCFFGR